MSTTSFVYDALHRETNRTLANGMVLNLAYDPNGREVYRQLSSGAGVLLVQTPIYGMPGQMLGLSESGSAVGGSSTIVTFGYDDTYQLTLEERAGYSSYFSYDGAGNRLLQVENGVVTSYAYDSANQQLQATSGASVSNSTFDANGNLTAKNAGGGVTSYTWDEEDRLVGVQEAGGARSTYLYSQDGERRVAQTATGNTRFVWDGVNLLQERDGASGLLLRHYSDFPGTWGGLTSVAQGVGSAGLFNVSRFNEGRFNESRGGVIGPQEAQLPRRNESRTLLFGQMKRSFAGLVRRRCDRRSGRFQRQRAGMRELLQLLPNTWCAGGAKPI